MEKSGYNFRAIEEKWQKKWEAAKCFEVKEDSKKKKFYCLEMYPYPSGSFLHMGHVRNYTLGDVYARFKRMSGFNVLYPMGYDSFGLPAESAAKKAGIQPRDYTNMAVKKIIAYQKALGNSYAWERTLSSHDPDYYKWNQYFFLKLFEKGLAYRKKALINWCEHCQSVLANEEAEAGKCWRCGNEVTTKEMEQWFLKITAYADELLEGLKKIEWPQRIITMQENWIGKSEGTEIDFEISFPKETNFVLLHGFEGSPKNNFFPWLKKELESRGYKVDVPKLPNTNKPNIAEQINFVLKNFNFNENTIILGHSLGGVIALKVLEKLKKSIKKLILAASFSKPTEEDRIYNSTLDWKFNFNKIKSNVREIVILRDKNDDCVPYDRADILQKEIGGQVYDFVAKDSHFSGETEPEVLKNCLEKWPVFTTRPDTLFGVTFMVISAQHPRLMELVIKSEKAKVEKFLKKLKNLKPEEIEAMNKQGVFTGSYAINPLSGDKVPVWAGNFVVADYGGGMVMAVPAHDQRDFEFAQKYKIPIKTVIKPVKQIQGIVMDSAYTGSGKLINSKEFNDLNSEEAKVHITKALETKKLGKKTVNYKIRDWLISRQRYWGTPIPMIHCKKCGVVSVLEKDLPVLLPDKADFKSKFANPLMADKKFLNVKCPKCKGSAQRETDTMGGFMDSSWYFLRYCDNKNKSKPFDKKKVEYWMPVDQYIGGAEHAVMHLIYARFFTRFLRDLKLLDFDEPFTRLFNQGMVYREGAKMSKSLPNVVYQTEISDKYGIDTARLFLMLVASPEKDMEWSDEGVTGAFRIINKLIRLQEKIKNKSDEREEHKINYTIKNVTESIEGFNLPRAIISITGCIDSLSKGISNKSYGILLKLISPFCPHLTEELWQKIGNKGFLSLEKWPIADEKKINSEFEKEEKIVEDVIVDVLNVVKIINDKGKRATKLWLYGIPSEKKIYSNNLNEIEKRTGLKTEVYAINDKNKHDPENKSKKARPGKPGIYLE